MVYVFSKLRHVSNALLWLPIVARLVCYLKFIWFLYASEIASRSLSPSSPEGDGVRSLFTHCVKYCSSARCGWKYFEVPVVRTCTAVARGFWRRAL